MQKCSLKKKKSKKDLDWRQYKKKTYFYRNYFQSTKVYAVAQFVKSIILFVNIATVLSEWYVLWLFFLKPKIYVAYTWGSIFGSYFNRKRMWTGNWFSPFNSHNLIASLF